LCIARPELQSKKELRYGHRHPLEIDDAGVNEFANGTPRGAPHEQQDATAATDVECAHQVEDFRLLGRAGLEQDDRSKIAFEER
jgi:hypothetical protein